MCNVSVMYDTARQQIPLQQWTPAIYNDFTEVIRLLKSIDERLGLKDCHDPAKEAFMTEVRDRLGKLESSVNR